MKHTLKRIFLVGFLALLTHPLNAEEQKPSQNQVWQEIMDQQVLLTSQLKHAIEPKHSTNSVVLSELKATSHKLEKLTREFSNQFETSEHGTEAARLNAYAVVIAAVNDVQRQASLNTLMDAWTSCSLPVEDRNQQLSAEKGLSEGLTASRPFWSSNNQLVSTAMIFCTRSQSNEGTDFLTMLKDDPATAENSFAWVKTLTGRKWKAGTVPQLKLETLTGASIDLSQLRGKVVLLNFWGTDCPPCVEEIPELKSLHEKYSPKGLAIIGVALGEDRKRVARMVTEKSIPWPVCFEELGFQGKAAVDFGIWGIPNNLLLNRGGEVREVMARQRLEQKIQFLLKEQSVSLLQR